MNPSRIDSITRLFAERKLTRRQSLAASGGFAASGTVSGLAAAQDASPDAPLAAPGAKHGPQMLFVQSFQSGSIVSRDDVAGRYTVTLEQGLGETLFFSDRPDRIVGSTPTARFLNGLGFSDDNPPNAAILTQNPDGDTTLAVVELFSPVYDDATRSVTYDLEILDHWQDATDLGFRETPVGLDALGAAFGTTHLFIDDCADAEMYCIDSSDRYRLVGAFGDSDHDGYCYSWGTAQCLPCQPWFEYALEAGTYWNDQCNERFPACESRCVVINIF